jgi:ring-1,2-phenylacetyl-CoA epoxidase subunit PaaD
MHKHTIESEECWDILETIPDPEIPVISIVDLGIVRNVVTAHSETIIVITPTYSGCPAMDMIRTNIREVFEARGYGHVTIQTVLSPAWTTDWMSEAGKEKLRAYGIAPPEAMQQACNRELFMKDHSIQCPRCHSFHTKLISKFGSTACKSIHQCLDCLEPFDAFKCH